MVWKSREDKLPPPSFFSMVVATLRAAYPDARVSREMMETLRPHFIEAWRNGQTAEAAAQTTCSCHRGEVVPSPAVGVRIARGTVRPPRGAQRGDVFGADALREPAPVERLQRRLTRVAREQAKVQTIEAKWGQRATTARKDATKSEAERKQAGASARYQSLMSEAQRIEAEIQRARNELGRARRTGSVSSDAPVVAAQKVSEAPPPPAPPAPTPAVPSGAAAKKPRKSAKAAAPASAPAPAGNEDAAMLSAIKGLLPDLASQLAAQMAKDEGGAK